jgi:hypothetical protein
VECNISAYPLLAADEMDRQKELSSYNNGKEVRNMTGSQIFVLVFLIGGAIAFGIFFMGLGVYYWGRNKGQDSKQDDKT